MGDLLRESNDIWKKSRMFEKRDSMKNSEYSWGNEKYVDESQEKKISRFERIKITE